MRKFRVIPSLLLRNQGFYKTVKFKSPHYVGDPINTLKLFNDKEVDEILIFDIEASKINSSPQFELIEELASECFVPLCYGGGIRNIDDIKRLFFSGVEKISLGKIAFENPGLISEAAALFGSQSIVVCIDVKKNFLGQYVVSPHGIKSKLKIFDYVQRVADMGAGEIIINNIDRDGTYKGLDQELCQQISELVRIPTVFCGGVSSLENIVDTVSKTSIQAVAAGSLFVYYGKERSVLINYPTENEFDQCFAKMEQKTNE